MSFSSGLRPPNLKRLTFRGDGDDDADDVGDGGAVVDLELIRKREVKWVEMLGKWDTFMMRDYKRVRSRCRKGIPTSVRSRAWTNLCGAKFLMAQNPGRFAALCVRIIFYHLNS